MAPNATFQSFNFNPFIVNDSLNDNRQGPDVKFFHNNVCQQCLIIYHYKLFFGFFSFVSVFIFLFILIFWYFRKI